MNQNIAEGIIDDMEFREYEYLKDEVLAISMMEYDYLINHNQLLEKEVYIGNISTANHIMDMNFMAKSKTNKYLDYIFVPYDVYESFRADLEFYVRSQCKEQVENKYDKFFGSNIVPYINIVDMLSKMKSILTLDSIALFGVIKTTSPQSHQ